MPYLSFGDFALQGGKRKWKSFSANFGKRFAARRNSGGVSFFFFPPLGNLAVYV